MDGPPDFWRKFLASCPTLLSAKMVYLSYDDICSGPEWVCRSVQELEITLRFGYKDRGLDVSSEEVKHRLIGRVGDLINLISLGLFDISRFAMTDGAKYRHCTESWRLLSVLKHLSCLYLHPGFLPLNDKSTVDGMSMIKGLRYLELWGCVVVYEKLVTLLKEFGIVVVHKNGRLQLLTPQ